ncbi:IS1182 family transposase [Dysgonomonas sp. 511]|uniref:IS1182 family transposase n=1 Tax=Dysgonomonas sp. 511 TaxID=2302930 RepID=UPI0021066394|nr:IS1182 family transposase [Dysgonomonas sp. 511]
MNKSKIVFKDYNQGLLNLFPCRLDENIPEHSPVRMINQVVDELDLSGLLSTYQGGGTSSYHPRMLLKVLFYAYLNNIYSCRKIEKVMQENIHYMWLSGSQYPSFSTINRFRSEHVKDCINSLFVQVVEMLVELGYLSLEVQYIDGTKIESVANKYSFVWKKSIDHYKGNLQKKIACILSQIEEGIAGDNSPLEDAPFEIDSKQLGERISRINKENRSKAELKQLKELEEKHLPKLEEYEGHLRIMGKRNSYSKTDHDATFMRMKEDAMNNGQTKPGYNLQIATAGQYILNYGFYPISTDTTTLEAFLNLGYARFGVMPETICADAGYGSEENYHVLETNHIESYVKYNYFHQEQKKKFKNNPFRQENLIYNKETDTYTCPQGKSMHFLQEKISISDNGYKSKIRQYQCENCQGCTLKEQCHKAKGNRIININEKLREYKANARDLLTSEQGLKHRSKRPIEPEAVFGQMKFNKGYKRFRHKGFEKINMDFGVFAIAFNLLKMWRKRLKHENWTNIACFYLKIYIMNPIADKNQEKYKLAA